MSVILKENDLVFAKVKPNAIIPTKEKENAGYDIYACFDGDAMVIFSNSTTLIPTGIASAMSDKWYLQVEERGSTGSKGMKKSAGVVDSSYRGEIFIAITNCNDVPIVISKADKENTRESMMQLGMGDKFILYPYEKAIAQLVVHEVPVMDVKEVTYEELLAIPSKRGTGALGSSNK